MHVIDLQRVPRRAGLLLMMLGCLPAAGQGREPVLELQAFGENFAPLSYLDGAEPCGFGCDLLRLMAAEAGLVLHISIAPWQRAVQDAAAHPASVLMPLVRLPERETRFRWVGPMAARRLLIYRLSRRNDIHATRLAGLRGLRVGVTRESAAAAQLIAAGLRPGTDLELGLDDSQNLRKLLAGRMDALVMLEGAAHWHLRKAGLPASTLAPVLPLDADQPYWYGLPADSDPDIARRLQDGLDLIRRDGRYGQLWRRWFG